MLLIDALIAVLPTIPAMADSPGAREPYVQPREYRSDDGCYAFRVIADAKYGAGAATCALEHDGFTLWSGRLPVTLVDAVVSSSGSVFGYGFDLGCVKLGNLLVARVDAIGGLRSVSFPTQRPRWPANGKPYPRPRGVTLEPDERHFVLRVPVTEGMAPDEWWHFDCATIQLVSTRPMRTISSARGVAEHEPVSALDPVVASMPPRHAALGRRIGMGNGRVRDRCFDGTDGVVLTDPQGNVALFECTSGAWSDLFRAEPGTYATLIGGPELRRRSGGVLALRRDREMLTWQRRPANVTWSVDGRARLTVDHPWLEDVSAGELVASEVVAVATFDTIVLLSDRDQRSIDRFGGGWWIDRVDDIDVDLDGVLSALVRAADRYALLSIDASGEVLESEWLPFAIDDLAPRIETTAECAYLVRRNGAVGGYDAASGKLEQLELPSYPFPRVWAGADGLLVVHDHASQALDVWRVE